MCIKPYVKCTIASNLTGVYKEELSSLLMQVLYQFVVYIQSD